MLDTISTDDVEKVETTEVVDIVSKFRHGVLNAEAEDFIPQPHPELKKDNLEPEKVVEIIKDSRSTKIELDRMIRVEASTSSSSSGNQNTPQELSNDLIMKLTRIVRTIFEKNLK